MTWTPGPWEHDGKFTVSMPIDTGEYAGGEYAFRLARVDDARLIAAAPDLVTALENVTTWLEGTEAFEQSHGAHFVAVEARKLLERVKGDDPMPIHTLRGEP